jgi:hypothetical protein
VVAADHFYDEQDPDTHLGEKSNPDPHLSEKMNPERINVMRIRNPSRNTLPPSIPASVS